jgi:nitrogen regulatory protein PII
MVDNHVAESVESTIATVAHTGKRGDGKVYVLPLAVARRISTGEAGAEGA